jgi:hypothetical protein
MEKEVTMLKNVSQKKTTTIIIVFLIIVSGFLLFNHISYMNRHYAEKKEKNIEVKFLYLS